MKKSVRNVLMFTQMLMALVPVDVRKDKSNFYFNQKSKTP